jgi:uncharacterized protein (TIGR02452 family)
MRDKNIVLLNETLKIIDTGNYFANNKETPLKLSKEQISEAIVITEERVKALIDNPPYDGPFSMGGRCRFSVLNTDSFAVAIDISKDYLFQTDKAGSRRVLVLNFANPVEPGGGVRRGARAQEEDLCRKSTLLASLDSSTASQYYKYNKNCCYHLSSDSMILSPAVEIIRDENNNLLGDSVVVSVLTCAALNVRDKMHGISNEVLEKVIYQRIMGMLQVATTYEYKYLVLGAWGCGAFGNDADMVARLFYKAFKEIRCGRNEKLPLTVNSLFRSVVFAVLDNSETKYNLNSFKKYFDNFYRDEDDAIRQDALNRKKENEKWLDAIRGSMIGGAAGDALGYAVEFLTLDRIYEEYGYGGITDYKIDDTIGKALISDDTQMTLFTACGILHGMTRGSLRGIMGPLESYIHMAYLDWLTTQTGNPSPHPISWLVGVDELHARRDPGSICLEALKNGFMGEIEFPINDNKGCGGIMRVAPIALYFKRPLPKLPLEGAKAAAITHGHPLGYMPAAALVFIISRIIYGGCPAGSSLYSIVNECCELLKALFPDNKYLHELLDIIELAKDLSLNGGNDAQNIKKLGGGWVAEEALAISLYCSLKYYDDFSSAIIAAVNHDGDSDSTGSITGNIVGAHIGYSNIPQKWKMNLQLHDIILEVADDLCHGCQMSEYSSYMDQDWMRKYGAPGSFFINSMLRGIDLQSTQE